MKGYFWVIGGGLLQIPLISEVKALGYNVIVTDGNPNCVCASHADRFSPLDIYDIPAHIAWANMLKAEGLSIAAVLAAGIDAPETMCALCEHLGLPSVSSSIARLVNHKDLFRQKMVELDIPRPQFISFTQDDLTRLPDIARKIGYPLIVKNSCSSGSRGTKIFYEENDTDLVSVGQDAIAVSRSGNALIESLWVGTEHTVETLFDCNGHFHRCFITDRLFDKRNGYPLETGLVQPSQRSVEEQEQMYQLAETVARQIGVHIGAAKYDMIFTPDGPRIIEIDRKSVV